jgi:hypothetical protein
VTGIVLRRFFPASLNTYTGFTSTTTVQQQRCAALLFMHFTVSISA